LHDVLAQGSGNNMSGWHDPAYEALLKAASLEQDETRRGQLMHDAENLALEAAPLLPLFTSTQSGLKRPSLKGFVDSVMGEHPYKTLYFDQAETP
jgi:oligopeptide transport system substrate-binding protein